MFACTGTRASNSLALFGAFIPGKRLNFNTSADIFSIIPLKNMARWNQKSSATLLVEPKELYPQKHSANQTPYPFNKWYPSATLDTKTSILVESSHHQICHSFLQFQYKRHVYAVFVWFLFWNNKRQKQKKWICYTHSGKCINSAGYMRQFGIQTKLKNTQLPHKKKIWLHKRLQSWMQWAVACINFIKNLP